MQERDLYQITKNGGSLCINITKYCRVNGLTEGDHVRVSMVPVVVQMSDRPVGEWDPMPAVESLVTTTYWMKRDRTKGEEGIRNAVREWIASNPRALYSDEQIEAIVKAAKTKR